MANSANLKKSAKGSLVGNMRKPVISAAPVSQVNDLVYGTPDALPTPVTEEANKYIMFTNSLPEELYIQVQQYKFWGRVEIRKILSEALKAYLADKPDAQRPLEGEELAKLQKKLKG